MRMYDIIEKKRNGGQLSPEEIRFIVNGYVAGEIPDYQMSALLMAIYFRGMDQKETSDLTLTMAHSGDMVDLSAIEGVTVDKHSTGGVGDKTTLIVAPIVASLGVKVAKMSGRGLGHTGGTLDKLESIPGFSTALSTDRFFEVVNECGVAVVGQTGNLDPADKLIYALRDVTATVDSTPLIASSIMSKKIAAGASKILLDVKVGSGAFMKTEEDAIGLAEAMVGIGSETGRETMALISDMNRPLGHAIGNALEIREVIDTLKGQGPEDLYRICVELAANMYQLASGKSLDQCREAVKPQFENGQGLEKLKQMIAAQDGDPAVVDNPDLLPRAEHEVTISSNIDGWICSMDTEKVGIASCTLGAGRTKKEDAIDYGAGILLYKKLGDKVRKGDKIATLRADDTKKLAQGLKVFEESYDLDDLPTPQPPLLYARINASGVERYQR